MKRYNNLFDKIVSLDNLYLADKKARRNKSSRKDIKEFDQNKEELLKKLQQVKYYFRYADDIVILHNNKEYLWSLFEEMKQYIATLKLSFKDNYQIFKVEDRGISFVGYVIRHDYTLVRKNIKRSMCRKAARLGRKKHITVEDYKL